ncbi:L-ribulose-5-phosphate 4-epimerase [Alkalihalobacillus sp. CinArs1]|uniref:L-ribulose-5-phosphate 4-epimerase n=1 Tax=Alkalihalobacillus sp. CinArs1 TaxID=2995314 RepID=UPI0022DD2570|nr:L-ribulose-5-phosphate 4-epimerase [Alkalihalobacillus sp. CinArs1]
MLEALKERVCALNRRLPTEGLVKLTSGNVSGRDPSTGLIIMKPSGMPYEEMRSEDMLVMRECGHILEGTCAPSVDTETHLEIYKHKLDIHGVVHTHSNYATSFAALGLEIPPAITSVANYFGGPVPVGPYVSVGGKAIGEAILQYIGRSTAILMKNHGVFTVGSSPEAAFKSAVVVEDVAKTIHLAMAIGKPVLLTEDQVESAFEFYQYEYGQK